MAECSMIYLRDDARDKDCFVFVHPSPRACDWVVTVDAGKGGAFTFSKIYDKQFTERAALLYAKTIVKTQIDKHEMQIKWDNRSRRPWPNLNDGTQYDGSVPLGWLDHDLRFGATKAEPVKTPVKVKGKKTPAERIAELTAKLEAEPKGSKRNTRLKAKRFSVQYTDTDSGADQSDDSPKKKEYTRVHTPRFRFRF